MQDGGEPFESKLGKGSERFLAHVIEHGFAVQRRLPEDFIRHFPPAAIMGGLADHPQLRANILIMATGVRPGVAAKKSVQSCTEDLEIALSVDEADAETVVALFAPDDRIRYLPAQQLWAYVTEGDFWETDRLDEPAYSVARSHISFMLDRGLQDGLITHRDLIDGIKVEKLAELLPRPELAKIIEAALAQGTDGNAFTPQELLERVPTSIMTEHVALPAIWEGVIRPRIAEPLGFLGDTGSDAAMPNELDTVPPPSGQAGSVSLSATESAAGSADDPLEVAEVEAVDVSLEEDEPAVPTAAPVGGATAVASVRPFEAPSDPGIQPPPPPSGNGETTAVAEPAGLFRSRRRRR